MVTSTFLVDLSCQDPHLGTESLQCEVTICLPVCLPPLPVALPVAPPVALPVAPPISLPVAPTIAPPIARRIDPPAETPSEFNYFNLKTF